ncbi:MAG: tetratricopeptide repeat protein [Desulfovibrio sp.]
MKKLTVLLSILLISAALLLPPLALGGDDLSRPMTENTRKELTKAHKCIQNQRPECARNILSRYVEKSKTPHPYGILLYTNLLTENAEWDTASAVLEKGYTNYPECRQIVHNLAIVKYEHKEYEQSGELFLKTNALSKKPQPSIQYQAAVAFYLAEKFQRTYEVLTPLLEQQKVQKNWVRMAAHSLIKLKKWKKAERVLATFVKRSPEEHIYWKLLANVRMELKRYKKAATALEIAYRIKPPSKKERQTLSQLYLYIDAPLMATHALKDDFTSTPSPEVCDLMVRAYLTAGRADKSIDLLNKAIAQNPTAKRWLTKGRILYSKRRYQEATEALVESVKLGENKGKAAFLLGMAYWEQKQWQNAREWFQKAKQFKPQSKRAARALRSIEAMEESKRQSAIPLNLS